MRTAMASRSCAASNIDHKLLNIKIANQQFDESTENIRYITENFELPEVSDLATNHPEEVAAAIGDPQRSRSGVHDAAGMALDDFQVQVARCIVGSER